MSGVGAGRRVRPSASRRRPGASCAPAPTARLHASRPTRSGRIRATHRPAGALGAPAPDRVIPRAARRARPPHTWRRWRTVTYAETLARCAGSRRRCSIGACRRRPILILGQRHRARAAGARRDVRRRAVRADRAGLLAAGARLRYALRQVFEPHPPRAWSSPPRARPSSARWPSCCPRAPSSSCRSPRRRGCRRRPSPISRQHPRSGGSTPRATR